MHADSLDPPAQFFVKHSRHAKKPASFMKFTQLQSSSDAYDPSSSLLQFLQQESLEEQRINFMNQQARDQTQMCVTNKLAHDREINTQAQTTHAVQYQHAAQHIADFIEQSKQQINRFISAFDSELNHKQALLVQQSSDQENVQKSISESTTKFIAEYPMLASLKQFLLKVTSVDDLVGILRYTNFVDYFRSEEVDGFVNNLTAQKQIVCRQDVTAAIAQFQVYIQQYLEKQNMSHATIQDFDPNAQVLPEPVDKHEYQKLTSFEDCSQVMLFVQLLGTLLNTIVIDDQTKRQYEETELVESITDLNLLASEEGFKKATWFLFKELDDHKLDDDDKKPPSGQTNLRAQVPVKQQEVKPKTDFKDIEPDYDFQLDYCNLQGTKVIFVLGCRHTGKTQLCLNLIDQLKQAYQETDIHIQDPRAFVVIQNTQSQEQLIQQLTDNIKPDMQSPKFLIIDGTPIFQPTQVNELVTELVQRQVSYIDNLISTKQKLTMPSKYGENTSRTQTGSKQRAPGDGRQQANCSYIFKIIVQRPSFSDFLEMQYGRINFESKELHSYDQYMDKLIERQMSGLLEYNMPVGQNFVREFQLFDEFCNALQQFFETKSFGVVFQNPEKIYQENAQNDVICKEIVNQTIKNYFVLDYSGQNQTRFNQKLLIKACRQLNVELNKSITEFNRKRDEFFATGDQKKVKALQAQKPKEKTGEMDLFDAKVITALKGAVQQHIDKFFVLQEQFQNLVQRTCGEQIKATICATFYQEQATKSQIGNMTQQFDTLLKDYIQESFNELLQYVNSIDPAMRSQDVIVGDCLILFDKVLQDNLQQIQKLFTSCLNEFKQQAAESVQLNKKLPFNLLQKIEQILTESIGIEQHPIEMRKRAEVVATPVSMKSTNQTNQTQRPDSKPGGDQQPKIMEITNDSQLVLLQFYKVAWLLRQVVQQAYTLQMQFRGLSLIVQSACLGTDVPIADHQKAKINPKATKIIDAQLILFDGQQLQIQIDGQSQAQDLSVDRLLEIIEQVYNSAQANMNLQQISVTGDATKIEPNSIFKPQIEQFDAKVKQMVQQQLDLCKESLKKFATSIGKSLKLYQEELDKQLQQSSGICQGVVEKMTDKLGAEEIERIVIEKNGVNFIMK